MVPKILTEGRALPIVLFPAITTAAIIVLGRCFVQSGMEQKLLSVCDASVDAESSPYRLAYTGVSDLDHNLCLLVGFFHGLMDPSYRPLVAEIMPSIAAAIAVLYAEAARETHPSLLHMPVVVGIIFQCFTFAVVMPVYWLVFVLTGSATRHASSNSGSTKINQANAEALLFALLVGFVIPTVGMFVLEDPTVTVIWQGFPFWMELAQFAHRLIRPPTRFIESGYRTIQATYSFVFLASAALHITYVWPIVNNHPLLKLLFVPSLLTLDPGTPLKESIAHFIKWDMIFGAGSSILATFWFAENVKELTILLLSHICVTAVFGPGAAIAGAFMWREAKLNTQVHGVEQVKEKEQ
ncbi:hypothetical protein BV22DRAFT_1074737 [Leucogyrophana mollusca]|uniref:Uncharacterized protein n=1 Tax=Leucogyrophana mollusca TaxID=85980 RepID=A0ACB8B2Y1_9AGAM|nr:hypothetical protein BV22DRAFT_1074737 [Leucogyrophana mollusca]